MSGPPDLELIDRCRRGDEGAFQEVVDAHKGMVFALIGRAIGDRARVEELAQDVFLRVHRGLPHFRGEARLATWIYRIVVNVIAEERGARTIPTVSLDEPVAAARGPRLEPAALDRAFDALELRDRLDRALARLPLRYQVLIHGHYIKGIKYEELAAALGLPLGTVKTHLHRAKRLLREMLETELP